MLEEAINAMKSMDNAKARVLVERVIYLYAVYNVKSNLGWYL